MYKEALQLFSNLWYYVTCLRHIVTISLLLFFFRFSLQWYIKFINIISALNFLLSIKLSSLLYCTILTCILYCTTLGWSNSLEIIWIGTLELFANVLKENKMPNQSMQFNHDHPIVYMLGTYLFLMLKFIRFFYVSYEYHHKISVHRDVMFEYIDKSIKQNTLS